MNFEEIWKNTVNGFCDFIENITSTFLRTIIQIINNVSFSTPEMPISMGDVMTVIAGCSAVVIACVIGFKLIQNMFEISTGTSQTSNGEILSRAVKANLFFIVAPWVITIVVNYFVFPICEYSVQSIQSDMGTVVETYIQSIPLDCIRKEISLKDYDCDVNPDYTDDYKIASMVMKVDNIHAFFGEAEDFDGSEQQLKQSYCEYLHDVGVDAETYNINLAAASAEFGIDIGGIGGLLNFAGLEEPTAAHEWFQNLNKGYAGWLLSKGMTNLEGVGLLVAAALEAFVAAALCAFLLKQCVYLADIVFMEFYAVIVGISMCTDNNNYVDTYWKSIISSSITVCSQILLLAGFCSLVSIKFTWPNFMLLIGISILLLRKPHVLNGIWYTTGSKKAAISGASYAGRGFASGIHNAGSSIWNKIK